MEVQIEGIHTEVEASLQAWIHDKLAMLNNDHEDIIHARVALVKHERHQKGGDEARVFLTLSNKTLSATRQGDTLQDALYDVLDAMERELGDFRDIRRGVVKGAGPRPRGRIVRLFPERNYGFIETESHREVYFHANSVHGVDFAKLTVGMNVDLDIEAGNQGPQASRVTPRWP